MIAIAFLQNYKKLKMTNYEIGWYWPLNKKKKEEKENIESTTLSEINESENHINTEAEINEINLEENNDSSDNTENNNDSADNNEEEKEYDSDSVFAKLQELKND